MTAMSDDHHTHLNAYRGGRDEVGRPRAAGVIRGQSPRNLTCNQPPEQCAGRIHTYKKATWTSGVMDSKIPTRQTPSTSLCVSGCIIALPVEGITNKSTSSTHTLITDRTNHQCVEGEFHVGHFQIWPQPDRGGRDEVGSPRAAGVVRVFTASIFMLAARAAGL